MFDVSLFELALIALVALLVLGPEKLPRAARTVGLYVRKARQSWYSVRADIERELAADDLKRSIGRDATNARSTIERELGVEGIARDLKATDEAMRAPTALPAATPSRDEPPAP
jgi:sec-independent protein translocase protein TatB